MARVTSDRDTRRTKSAGLDGRKQVMLVAETNNPSVDRSTRGDRRRDITHLLTSDASSGSANAIAFVLMAPLKILD